MESWMNKLGLISLLLFLVARSAISAVPKINVRIGKKLKQITIQGTDISSKVPSAKSARMYSGKQNLKFNCRPVAKYKILKKPVMLSSLKSSTGLVRWKGKSYTGRMKIITSEDFKGCDLVNEITLESYISSLLAKEVSPSWPEEALKAQAVAARTYAYHKIISKQVSKTKGFKTHYDLENSEKHQVNGSYFDITKSTAKAAKLTSGMVLSLPSGQMTPIFFHSKCGGHTRRPEQVWGNKVKGYRSVNCPFCHKHGKKDWSLKLNKNNFNKILSRTVSAYHRNQTYAHREKNIKIVPDKNRKSFIRVYKGDKPSTILKSRIRSIVGRSKLPSNYFDVKAQGNKVILKGKGYGHGVGMCQFGAYELAKRGYTYKQILKHYFPEHILERIYK